MISDENISFGKFDFLLLKHKISKYKNQNVLIVVSPEFQIDAELLYNELKQEFKVSISYIANSSCYNNAGLNTLWCSMRENIRLIIALGNEHTHNMVKLLALKSDLPYCYLCRDFPNLYTLSNGIKVGGNLSFQTPQCLFINYNLEKSKTNSLAYTISQIFSLAIIPLENFLFAKLNDEKINVQQNKIILTELEKLISLLKSIFFDNKKARNSLCQITLKLSKLFCEIKINSTKYFAENLILESGENIEKLPLYHYFCFQVVVKILLYFFDLNCSKPFAFPLTSSLMLDKKIIDAEYNNAYNKNKVYYISSLYNKQIMNYLSHLNSLQKYFSFIIKRFFLDSGYLEFNAVDYNGIVRFVKNKLFVAPPPLFDILKMVEII